MQCASCSTVLLAGARFCHVCGTPVADAKRSARKHVTALFADIVGSTRLLTKLDPEDVRRVLGTVMSALRAVIEQSGGVVAKTMGDGVFALFGAPKALENHAYLACRAALEMQRIAPTLLLAPGVPVRLRIGLNTGVAVIFTVGEGPTATIDAVGDVVNRAAHLEARAAVGSVLASRATVRQAGARVVVRKAPAQGVSGKGADQECFEVLECGADIDPVLLDPAARLLRFVGRARERAFVETAIQALLRGEGDRIALVGETGVGKTRLLAECHGALDELVRAESLAREACALAVRTKEAAAEAYSRTVLAGLLRRSSRPTEAAQELAAARAVAERLSMRPLLADLESLGVSAEA
ncbi:MAG: adenylate/guanylate cyclase domain-containing protein [Gammaproteobacteria bacterium]|nr:adenylate/guanylate cyclase domain-containing protein [Gammaproteobacteria bacterium]